jgi:DNA mismatch repair protein MutL
LIAFGQGDRVDQELKSAQSSGHIVLELPDMVINQIKAGEVVERPLSVVKELVENALDADATEVSVDIFDGGKAMIRVTDTGAGMSPQDAVMSLRRHATSKISAAEDLEHIATFGFRGEALASIAAVSKFVLRTRRALDPAATQVEVDSTGLTTTRTVASPPGTQVEVAEIFCNTPARQKFLRNAATEYAHIHDFVQAMALAFPHVGWSFTHNRRRVFQLRPAQDFKSRMKELLGEGLDDFVDVSFERGSFRVQGVAGLPEKARAVPSHFLLFVNGRLVRDKVIRAGVMQAYSGMVLKGLVPSVVLFVQCDPTWVDVNAHPNKTEVRFRDPLVVQDLVCLAIVNQLRSVVQERALPGRSMGSELAAEPDVSRPASRGDMPSFLPASRSPVVQAGQRFESSATQVGQRLDSWGAHGAKFGSVTVPRMTPSALVRDPDSFKGGGQTGVGSPLLSEEFHIDKVSAPLRYLGQFQKLYLIFESTASGELWIVDQHAFHERILFETYLRAADAPVPRQTFLTPHFVALPAGIGPLLQEHAAMFEHLGFEVEWCEDMDRLAVHAYPSFVEVSSVDSVFDEVLCRLLGVMDRALDQDHPLVARARSLRGQWAAEGRQFPGLESRDVYQLMYATVACHAAVRAGQELRMEQAAYLISRAHDVDFSAHCPHGRPVIRRLARSEVDGWFSRI